MNYPFINIIYSLDDTQDQSIENGLLGARSVKRKDYLEHIEGVTPIAKALYEEDFNSNFVYGVYIAPFGFLYQDMQTGALFLSSIYDYGTATTQQ